jgi:hypothetical protein
VIAGELRWVFERFEAGLERLELAYCRKSQKSHPEKRRVRHPKNHPRCGEGAAPDHGGNLQAAAIRFFDSRVRKFRATMMPTTHYAVGEAVYGTELR